MADDVQPVLTENLKVLLDKARPELKALPEEKIVQRKITPSRVLALTKVMRRSCQRLLGVLDDELAAKQVVERKAQIAGIANRARVFYAADLRAAEIDANPVEVVNDALAVRVKAYDHQLYKWALPTFGDDPVKAAILRDIARGSGKRDDANDVLRLVGMFQDNLKFALTKAPEITETLLDEAEAAAMQQLEELDSADPNPAKDLAARAYSAWHHDYKLLRRLGFYVFGDLPDVGKRFPGISSGSSRRSAIETLVSIEEFDEDEEDEDDEDEDLEDEEVDEDEDDEEEDEEEEPMDEPMEPPKP